MRRLALLPAVFLVLIATLVSACGSDDNAKTVTVITHDSFNLSEDLIRQFEAENDATVRLLPKGDAGAMLTALILTKGNPEGDVAFGVDNTLLSRAIKEGVFQGYSSPLLGKVPNEFQAEGSNLVTPIDYGYVNFNYDIEALEERNIEPPTRLEDLTDPRFKGLVVVENPASSSPGLAFLIATIDYFGESRYLAWWQAMKANGLVVVDGWETAYNTNFTLYGGSQPIVLSYATSPAFEQLFADPPRADAPTANLLADKAVFRQVEYAGVLKNAKNEDLAGKFIDFLLSVPAQEDIPGQMAVYPVNSDAKVPEAFLQFSKVEVEPASIGATEIADNLDKWLNDWTNAVAR